MQCCCIFAVILHRHFKNSLMCSLYATMYSPFHPPTRSETVAKGKIEAVLTSHTGNEKIDCPTPFLFFVLSSPFFTRDSQHWLSHIPTPLLMNTPWMNERKQCCFQQGKTSTWDMMDTWGKDSMSEDSLGLCHRLHQELPWREIRNVLCNSKPRKVALCDSDACCGKRQY